MMVVTLSDRIKGGLYGILSNYILLKNRILNRLEGKPDVLIIGENHINSYHAETEAKIIEDFKPKYVLLEQSQTSDTCKEDTLRKFENIIKIARTLKDFSEISGIPLDIILDVFEKTKPYIKEIKERVKEKLRNKTLYVEIANIIPTTPKELLETPYYRIPSEFWELYSKIAEEEMWKLYNKLSEGGKKLINWQNPPLRYYQLLHQIAFGYYLSNLSLEVKGIDRGASTYKLIVMDSAIRTGAKIGCFDTNEEIRNKSLFDYVALKERERIMGLNIIKYLKENGGPIIVITGNDHARKDSELLKVLEEHGIKYRVIRLPTLPFTYNKLDALIYATGAILYSEDYQTEEKSKKSLYNSG